MAASSSSGAGRISKGPQVFINFRGEELRTGFVDYLETALEEAKINVFIDDDLELGTELKDLFVKIEQSKVALAIFSKEYSTSVWCLDELVKIKECVDKGSLIGIPIFYKLKTSVVSNLEGKFGDNFRRLKRNHQHDLVKTEKWEKALTSIPDLKGMHLPEKSERSDREFINSIVMRITTLLDKIPMERNTDSSMIYARKIEITHSEKPENWTWSSIQEAPNEAPIEIATLNEVYWMDIRGSSYTRKLTPGKKYKVVFVVKLEDNATGWDEPVNLNMKLVMRDKSEILQEQTCHLDDFIGDEWAEVKAGDFVAPPMDTPARISFTMFQYDDTIRKTGLVVKGVAIREVD